MKDTGEGQERQLQQLVFLLAGEDGRRDAGACREQLRSEGVEVQIYACPSRVVLSELLENRMPAGPAREHTLFVTDAAQICEGLRGEGCCTAGYLHRGNRGERFRDVPYVIEEPGEIDADSYEKIWQRASGRPWCIARTRRLVLREMVPEDLEELYALYGDSEARRFLPPLSARREEEQELLNAYIRRMYPFYGYGMWAVCRRGDDRMIGRAGLSPCQNDGNAVELGYLIRFDLRGQGLAREAGEAVLRFARQELGEERVLLYTDPANEASRRVAAALGFRLLGREGEREKWRIDFRPETGIRQKDGKECTGTERKVARNDQ